MIHSDIYRFGWPFKIRKRMVTISFIKEVRTLKIQTMNFYRFNHRRKYLKSSREAFWYFERIKRKYPEHKWVKYNHKKVVCIKCNIRPQEITKKMLTCERALMDRAMR